LNSAYELVKVVEYAGWIAIAFRTAAQHSVASFAPVLIRVEGAAKLL